MRRIVGKIDKERLILVCFNEVHRSIRKVVDDKAISFYDLAIVFQHRAVVVAPMPGAESVILIESPRVWMVRGLHSVVPLSEGRCLVSVISEYFSDGDFIEVQPFFPPTRRSNTSARIVTSC